MKSWLAFAIAVMAVQAPLPAAELLIGWASANITPARPVTLSGQFHTRISKSVQDPITATALALDNGRDRAVMVSLDVISIPGKLMEAVRARLKTALPELDGRNLLLNATPSRRRHPPTRGAGSLGSAQHRGADS